MRILETTLEKSLENLEKYVGKHESSPAKESCILIREFFLYKNMQFYALLTLLTSHGLYKRI